MSTNSLFIQPLCSAVRYSNAKRQSKQKAAFLDMGLRVGNSGRAVAIVMDRDVTAELSVEKRHYSAIMVISVTSKHEPYNS